MNIMKSILASTAVATVLAAPFAASASDDPNGLIAYKMGLATAQPTEAPVNAVNRMPSGDLHGGGSYAVMDVKTGEAQPIMTSDGRGAMPADTQIHKDSGMAMNKSEAGDYGEVVSADNAAVGRITGIEHGQTSDTLHIRVSDTLRTDVTHFRINVPKSAERGGQVHLAMTLSDLLSHLNARG